MNCATTNSLKSHLKQKKHTDLEFIVSVPGRTKAETFARINAVESGRFDFISSVDHFACKYCKNHLGLDLDLKSDITALQYHKSLRSHYNNLPKEMQTEFDETMLQDPKRIAKIDDLVSMLPDVLGKATKFDVMMCQASEYFLDKPTLRENALYCKVCRREFDRCDEDRYLQAVHDHLITDVHISTLKFEQKKKEAEIQALINGESIPISPLSKICRRTFHAKELKQLTSTRLAEGRSFDSVDKSDRRSTVALIGRTCSKSTSITHGLDLVYDGNNFATHFNISFFSDYQSDNRLI